MLVARHSDNANLDSASIQMANYSASRMPNFDHLSLIQKIQNFKFLFRNRNIFDRRDLSLRDKVLLSYFYSLKPNLVHFHDANLAATMAWIPQQLGVPYTISLRGSDIQVLPLLIEGYASKLRKAIIYSAGVHSVSTSLWKIVSRICNLSERAILHQTIYTTVPIQDQKHILRTDGEFHFISVGRFHWRKSYTHLLMAFRSLLDKGLKAELMIIGDGPTKDELIYWIHALQLEDAVKMPGKLPYEEISKIMQNSDAYVQSSIAEGVSNATAEAMAMGLPVFATEVDGTAEIIQDGENGFLLDPFRPDNWYEKLVLVKNRQLMESIGKAAWVTANEFFSAERHANEFIEFYKKALSG